YDALNRVIAIENGSTPKLRLEYDESVNPVVIDFPGGVREEHTFDELNRLTGMTRTDPQGSGPSKTVVNFKYNDNGLILAEDDGKSSITYRLDVRGKLMGIEDEQTFATEFGRDARGRPTAMRDPSGEYVLHYGAGNQLLRIIPPNGAEQRFEYDELLRQTKRVLIGPEGEKRCSRRYRYDVAGQLVWMQDWRLGVRT